MKTFLRFVAVLVAAIGLVRFPTAHAATDIEARLEELERQQAEMFRQMNTDEDRVKPFLLNEIRLGGYFETGLTRISGPRMGVQTSAPAHLLGINIAAKISEDDRFVGQLQSGLGYTLSNRHSDPRVTSLPFRQYTTVAAPTLLAHAFYEHSFSQALNVQFGLGYVPFGLAYQYREPQLLRRRGGDSQMISQSATQDGGIRSVGVAFPLWMGAHVLGSIPVGSNTLGYHAYTFTPSSDSTSLGEGARLWFRFLDFVTFGVSGQMGDTRMNYSFRSVGADIEIKYQGFGLVAEVAQSRFTDSGPDAPGAFYITPYIEFFGGEFLVYGFADYLDNPTAVTGVTGTPADPYKRLDAGGGVNWLPRTNVRFRLGYTRSTYRGSDVIIKPEERGFDTMDFSTVVAF